MKKNTSRRRPRYTHATTEKHERWLVSYADLITLMFAFFVVMYAVSSVNDGKYRLLSQVMTTAFRDPSPDPIAAKRSIWALSTQNDSNGSHVDFVIKPLDLRPLPIPALVQTPFHNVDAEEQIAPLEIAEATSFSSTSVPSVVEEAPAETEQTYTTTTASVAAIIEDPLTKLMENLQTAMADFIEADLIRLRRDDASVEVEIRSNILFTSGSATLDQTAELPLKRIATALGGISHPIQVEGFTDDMPISNAVFPSNWELSAARAASVVHLLMNEGVSPERMAAIGYGEHKPIADNATERGRARNRRVVLVVLGEDKDTPAIAPASEVPLPPYGAKNNLISRAELSVKEVAQ